MSIRQTVGNRPKAFFGWAIGSLLFLGALSPGLAQDVVLTAPTLPAGASITVTFSTTVDNPLSAGASQVCNQGTVGATGVTGFGTDDPAVGGATDPTCTPVEAEPDLVMVSKGANVATATPGGTILYSLTFNNVGDQNATGVVLSETVPLNTTSGTNAAWEAGSVGSGTPCNAQPAGTTCFFSYGALAAGGPNQSVNFQVVVASTVAAGVTSIDNVATVVDDGSNGTDPTANNGGSLSLPLDAEPDLAITKDDGGATTTPGGTVAYTLTYSNGGDQGAVGVVLTETVPANSTFNAGASTAGWACLPNANAGSTCTLTIGALAAGGSGMATFAVDVDSPVPAGVTEISNTASIADDGANGTDPTPGNNSDSDTTPLIAAPDLAISKDDGGITAVPGATISYVLSYGNNGNQSATGVVLTETVPANSTFNAGASTAGWACVPNGNPGSVCTLVIGALAASANGMATFSVTVDSPLIAGISQISNTASVADDGTNGPDPTPGDNSGSDTTPVDAEPVFTIDKTYSGSTPTPGDTIDFELAYANTGNQGASGVVLTETVPVHTTFNAGASTAGWVCVPDINAGSICTLTLGELAGGANGVATFAVTLDDPLALGAASVENCASIADDDANGGNPFAESCESVTLDNVPPQLTAITTIEDTGDGTLEDCETARVEISDIVLTFDELMFDPPGDTEAQDVTNPANYLLLSPAMPGADFDTTTCFAGTGADLVTPVDAVSYDDVNHVATLSVAPDNRLPNRQYRVIACGSSLADAAGNLLDGDGNGTGGDDFSRDFRVDFGNLFANGHFDCDLADWTPAGMTSWDSSDADSSPLSGSAATPPTAGSGSGVGQCVAVASGLVHTFDSRALISAPPSVFVGLVSECSFFDQAGCAGTMLSTSTDTFLAQDSAGVWISLERDVMVPANAVSASCSFGTTPTASAVDVFVDQLRISADEIFSDGFESGDTSAWTATVQ